MTHTLIRSTRSLDGQDDVLIGGDTRSSRSTASMSPAQALSARYSAR
jgi:hypothetical protein